MNRSQSDITFFSFLDLCAFDMPHLQRVASVMDPAHLAPDPEPQVSVLRFWSNCTLSLSKTHQSVAYCPRGLRWPKIILLRTQKGRSALQMARCASNTASSVTYIPRIGPSLPSWSSCTTDEPHVLHLPHPQREPFMETRARKLSIDMLHSFCFSDFPSSGFQVPSPPAAFAGRIR